MPCWVSGTPSRLWADWLFCGVRRHCPGLAYCTAVCPPAHSGGFLWAASKTRWTRMGGERGSPGLGTPSLCPLATSPQPSAPLSLRLVPLLCVQLSTGGRVVGSMAVFA